MPVQVTLVGNESLSTFYGTLLDKVGPMDLSIWCLSYTMCSVVPMDKYFSCVGGISD